MNKSVDKYAKVTHFRYLKMQMLISCLPRIIYASSTSHLTYPVSITVLILGDNKNYEIDMR
jgi:hypothetical protein